jgi:hypothetical protein
MHDRQDGLFYLLRLYVSTPILLKPRSDFALHLRALICLHLFACAKFARMTFELSQGIIFVSGRQLSCCNNKCHHNRETAMIRDQLVGRLKQINGRIKEHWCTLNGDQIGLIAAKRYQIAGLEQAQCGLAQKKSRQQHGTYTDIYFRRRYN